jgi:type I restriction enzyme S subunit
MTFLKDIIEKPLTGEWGTDGDEVNVLRTTNFTNLGVLDFSNVVKRSISEKKVEQKKLLKGDIIIEKSGGSPKQPVGRVVFFNEEGTYLCNNFTSILRPKKEKVEPKYLHYLLYASHRFGVTGMFQNKTTGIINLQLPRYVNKLEIPLPTLKTQQHIAQILDDAAALRDKTKQLLKEYDLLAQAIFLDMFGDPVSNSKGWEVEKLSKVAPFRKYDGIIKNNNGNYWLLNLDMIEQQTGEIIEKKFVLENEINSSTITFNENQVLYSKLRPYLNKVLIPDETGYGTSELVPLNPVKGIVNKVFLACLLKSNSFVNYINVKVAGAKMPRVNMDTLRSFITILPPIELQNQFAEKIALIYQQKNLAKQELQESEDLFNCLLQKAFKGELV